MTRAGAGALVAIALTAALALRAARLDVRPMHHDEANQAIKFGDLLERGDYRYDYHDHHGPTLYYLTLPSAWLGGRHTLASLDEVTLRRVPVVFGAATILLLPLLSPGIGRTATAVAALLMSLSPAMVFYSRMFIQEALFACFTLAFVIAVGRIATNGGRAWWILAGVAAGLAVATKETSVIVLPAAIVACVIAWSSGGSERPRNGLTDGRWRASAFAGLAAAVTVAALFYTSFFTAPAAILEPFRGAGTYLARGVDPGSHAHPWHYYVRLLAYTSSGGLKWSEGLVIVLAVIGAASGWRPIVALPRTGERATASEPRARPAFARSASARSRRSFSGGGSEPAQRRARARVGESEGRSPSDERGVFWTRYLACDVAIAGTILSVIPYKTPWNLLPFYVVAFALAGSGFAALLEMTRSRALRGVLAGALAIASCQLGWQAWRAAVTYAADPRNPYVYAQTVPDAVRMATRIRDLSALHADGARMQVSVVAPPDEQWPLPWYLRSMPNVGYWTQPGDAVALQAPVLVGSLEHTPALDTVLGDRYVSEFYGLRPDVLQALYIERGLWDRFLAQAK